MGDGVGIVSAEGIAWEARLAKLGLLLLQGGFLRAEDRSLGVTGAVTAAMGRWLDTQFGGLSVVQMRVMLAPSAWHGVPGLDGTTWAAAVDQFGDEAAERIAALDLALDGDRDHVGLLFVPDDFRFVAIGAGVEKLEAMSPGVGLALAEVATTALLDMDVWEHSFMSYAASSMYWGGCDNEADWIEEWGGDVEPYGGITRADLDAAFGADRLQAAGKPKTTQVRAWRADARPLVAEAGGLLQILLGTRKGPRPHLFFGDDFESRLECQGSIDPMACVVWNAENVARQIGDDYGNWMMESGEPLREVVGAQALVLDDGVDGFTRLERKWKAPLARIRAADRALSLLEALGQGKE